MRDGGGRRLGSRLVGALLGRGADTVVAFDRRPAGFGGEARVRVVTGELLRPQDVDRALAGCGLVFHLAGRTLPGESFRDPEGYFEANAQGTVCLLAACRRAGLRRIVFTSTGLVYGATGELAVPETHPTAPLSPYAATKLAAEAALAGYATAFALAVDVARLANVYGADDPPDTVVGRALTQALAGEMISLWDLSPIRDFLHVDDAVEGLIRLAGAGEEPGCRVLNLSTGRGTSIREMAETLIRVVRAHGGPPLAVREDGDGSRRGASSLVLANDRLRERTGWVPRIGLAEGLARAYRAGVRHGRG